MIGTGKFQTIEMNLQGELGKAAAPFIESLYEMNRTVFGKKLIKETPVFSVKMSPDICYPHILSEKSDIIYYPTEYDYQDRIVFLTCFSHEIQHLIQKKNKLLLTSHTNKGSVENFFIQDKLAEAQAEVTSSLVLTEWAQLNGNRVLKIKPEEHYKMKGAQMMKQMMCDEKSQWQEAYNNLAISHVAFLALTSPERIVRESQKVFHDAVLRKYAEQYAPFLEKKNLNIIGEETKDEIEALKKIISQKTPFLLKQFLLQKEKVRSYF